MITGRANQVQKTKLTRRARARWQSENLRKALPNHLIATHNQGATLIAMMGNRNAQMDIRLIPYEVGHYDGKADVARTMPTSRGACALLPTHGANNVRDESIANSFDCEHLGESDRGLAANYSAENGASDPDATNATDKLPSGTSSELAKPRQSRIYPLGRRRCSRMGALLKLARRSIVCGNFRLSSANPVVWRDQSPPIHGL